MTDLDKPILITRRELSKMIAREVKHQLGTALAALNNPQAQDCAHDWKARTDGREICRKCHLVQDIMDM